MENKSSNSEQDALGKTASTAKKDKKKKHKKNASLPASEHDEKQDNASVSTPFLEKYAKERKDKKKEKKEKKLRLKDSDIPAAVDTDEEAGSALTPAPDNSEKEKKKKRKQSTSLPTINSDLSRQDAGSVTADAPANSEKKKKKKLRLEVSDFPAAVDAGNNADSILESAPAKLEEKTKKKTRLNDSDSNVVIDTEKDVGSSLVSASEKVEKHSKKKKKHRKSKSLTADTEAVSGVDHDVVSRDQVSTVQHEVHVAPIDATSMQGEDNAAMGGEETKKKKSRGTKSSEDRGMEKPSTSDTTPLSGQSAKFQTRIDPLAVSTPSDSHLDSRRYRFNPFASLLNPSAVPLGPANTTTESQNATKTPKTPKTAKTPKTHDEEGLSLNTQDSRKHKKKFTVQGAALAADKPETAQQTDQESATLVPNEPKKRGRPKKAKQPAVTQGVSTSSAEILSPSTYDPEELVQPILPKGKYQHRLEFLKQLEEDKKKLALEAEAWRKAMEM
ncbi:hypothetical protein C8035_v002787 [Colletotrichum spinosum]|uniref:Uncharacterized protein n=1 Tax=Colletotrichum spinosum TaxID=1347390 RepID=A0A4R8PYD7_9PEZI|nr:hypothetical protein C8035_v002787 [Colletotrichum spinosum]